MGSFVASEIVKKMVQKEIPVKGSKALLLGFTFKENCPDVRNTRVIDIYRDLIEFGLDVTVYDPWVNKIDVQKEYGLDVSNNFHEIEGRYSAVILAVGHDKFRNFKLKDITEEKSIKFDIKSFFDISEVDFRL